MKKRKIFIICIVSIVILFAILLFKYYKNSNNFKYNNDTFLLDDEYYNEGNFIDISSLNLERIINKKGTFLLYAYNNCCNLPIPCESIFENVMKKYKLDVLQITFKDFKRTSLYDTIKFTPTLVIIKDGKIVDYLKADKDEDLDKYQDIKIFENWLKQYVILSK